ncbi:hypothetical protein Dimus_022692, partial [Dionaea muscipula]
VLPSPLASSEPSSVVLPGAPVRGSCLGLLSRTSSFLPATICCSAAGARTGEYVRLRMLHAVGAAFAAAVRCLCSCTTAPFSSRVAALRLPLSRVRLVAATRLRAGERSGCHATIDRDDLRWRLPLLQVAPLRRCVLLTMKTAAPLRWRRQPRLISAAADIRCRADHLA